MMEMCIRDRYKKLRPGELPTVDAARNLFNNLFFDPRRYDLSKVGKMCIRDRNGYIYCNETRFRTLDFRV